MMEELVLDACVEMEKSWMKPEVGRSKQFAKPTGLESALIVLLLRVECAKLESRRDLSPVKRRRSGQLW